MWIAVAIGCGTPEIPADDRADSDTGGAPVGDGIDLTGRWIGPCEPASSDTGDAPAATDWTFDLVDTAGDLTGTTGQAWVHGARHDHHVTFRLAFEASTTGSLNEEYFELLLDDTLTELTGELASYVTGPTWDCTFTREAARR